MYIDESSNVRTLETYTITEAAEALGRSIANFRRWVTGELIPAPFLKDTTRGNYCYCAEELRILLRILVEHERDYVYFGAKHVTVSNRMHQSIMGFRDITFGEG